ncbi:MAG: hypothetical protein KKB51_03710 [Candidatus Riflebacteria bacterium]|nr:hypothetical protein [Candidatus Riflebacteria bacterium]
MKKLRKLLVVLLLVSSVLMTGCDASKIIEVIGKVAQGVQQAMPAIKNVIDTFTNALGNNDNANNNTQQPAVQQPAETNTNTGANVSVVDPNKEDVGTGTTAGQTGQAGANYGTSGTASTLAAAAEVKAKYGITLVNGSNFTSNWETAAPGAWTSQQATAFAALMAKIPANFRVCTNAVAMQLNLKDKADGHEFAGLGGDPILLSSNALGTNGYITLEELTVHEMTHQFQEKHPDVENLWTSKFWPNGQQTRASITDYGNTNAAEDMAECTAIFFMNPELLRQQDPERYEFVKNNIWK